MSDRRLAAVMVTDMVGFTVLMGANEDHALELLKRTHEFLESIVVKHDGEWQENSGDRSLSTFPSAIAAVDCAIEILHELRNDPELKLRIGINVGHIVAASGHVYGETVNIAASIERLADPDGMVITQSVYDAVQGHIDQNVIDLGEKALKNIDHPVRLYALTGEKERHKAVNFLTSLVTRRVPHITGAYLAASWAAVEVVEWLSKQGAYSILWVYATIAVLLSLLPSVVLITYSHGAHGREHLTQAEKVGVPLNMIIAALVATYVVQNVEVPPEVNPIQAASVAVLPFVNLSDDEIGDYFSLGLSEELINALANVPGLHVASRTSSFLFDGREADPRDIASKLRVATILEGSVRKHGQNIRVTAQLIDGENNFHLWSETYDSRLQDILQLQEDIASAVAMELVGVLQPDTFKFFAEARASSLDVYEIYLEGLGYLRSAPSHESLGTARELFEHALTKDPDYAQAHAALCEVSLEEYLLDRSPLRIDAARSACSRALELDPGARDVVFALGELYRAIGDLERSAEAFDELLARRTSSRVLVGLAKTQYAQGNFTAAEEGFQAAIEREPGVWNHSAAYADFLFRLGRYDEAVALLEYVLELDPDNADAYGLLGACYFYIGETEASIAATKKSIELAPTRLVYRDLGLTYYYTGQYELAAEAYEHAVELGPDDHYAWSSLANVYRRLGGRDEDSRTAYARAITLAEAVLEQNPNDWETLSRLGMYNVISGDIELGQARIRTAVAEGSHLSNVNYHAAVVHSLLGQQEETLDAIERALDAGAATRMIINDPQFVDLRELDRFKTLVGQ